MHTPRESILAGPTTSTSTPNNNNNNNTGNTPRVSFQQQTTGTPTQLYRTSQVASAIASMNNNNNNPSSPTKQHQRVSSSSSNNNNFGGMNPSLLLAPGGPAFLANHNQNSNNNINSIMMMSPPSAGSPMKRNNAGTYFRNQHINNNNNNNARNQQQRTGSNNNDFVLSNTFQNTHLYDRFMSVDAAISATNSSSSYFNPTGGNNNNNNNNTSNGYFGSPNNNINNQQQQRRHNRNNSSSTDNSMNNGNFANGNGGGGNNNHIDEARYNLFAAAPRTYQRGMTRSRSPEDDEKNDEPYARLLQQTILSSPNKNLAHQQQIVNNDDDDDEDDCENNNYNNMDDYDESDALNTTNTSIVGLDNNNLPADISGRMSHLSSPGSKMNAENKAPATATQNLFQSSFFNNNHNNNSNVLYQVGSAVAPNNNISAGGGSSTPNNRNSTNFSNNTTMMTMMMNDQHAPLQQRNIIFPSNVSSSRLATAVMLSPTSPVTSPYQQQGNNNNNLPRLFGGHYPNNAASPSNNNNKTAGFGSQSNNNNDNPSQRASYQQQQPLFSGRNSSAYYSSAIVDDDDYARDSAASIGAGGGGSDFFINHNNGSVGAGTGVEGERFSWTLSSVYNANKARNFKSRAFRVIPQTPERILDAPDLLDDFYLHLLDWGSANVLAVALQHTLYLWNADTGDITQLMSTQKEDDPANPQAAPPPAQDYITGLSWHPDGNLISVGLSNSEVQLWDTAAQKLVRTYTGHQGRIGSLAWNSSGILASGGRDATVRLHDIRVSQSGVFGLLKGHTQEVCGLAWSPCGRRLASGGNDNLVNVWDFPVRYSNGGNSGAGLGGSTAATSRGTSPNGMDSSSSFGHFSASSAIEDGRPLVQLRKHIAAVKGLAWNPTRRGILATGGGTADKTLCFWDINAPVSTAVATPISLLNNSNGAAANSLLNNHPSNNLAHIHPSLAGASPSAIQAHFSVVQTHPLHSVDTQSQICGVLWSKDGAEVVTSHGYSEHQLSIWKYPSLRRIADLTGHGARVLHLAMSPDGEVVVSAAADETIRFWRCFAKPTPMMMMQQNNNNNPPFSSTGTSPADNNNNENDSQDDLTTTGGEVSTTTTNNNGRKSNNNNNPSNRGGRRVGADDADYEADWDLNLR